MINRACRKGRLFVNKSFHDYFEILNHHKQVRGDKTAIHFQQEKISYSSLDENICRLGNVLKKLGLKPQERIVIALPDCPDAFYSFFGSIRCGYWAVLISPELSKDDYEFILNDAQASALITVRNSEAVAAKADSLKQTLLIGDEAYQRLFKEASPGFDKFPAKPDDIAFMLYTSGSTGKPKGVPHSQSDMLYCAESYAGPVLGMSENDRIFSTSKLPFAYGLGNSLIFPLRFGSSIVLFPEKSTPSDIFRIIREHRPSLFFGVPTLYNMMLKTMDETVSFEPVRLCVSAGEALPASIYHGWKKLTGLEIIDGIGSTEALHIFISNIPGRVNPGSSGFIVPPYEAMIVGDDGRPVPSGQEGSLLIRGGSSAPFYWNLPDRTSDTMLEDGWLKTGDIYIEEGGCYTYQGRSDDMFKVGASWVSPVRVEEALRQHPAVLECAVTWRKLESLVKPLAYVVLNTGFSGDMKLSRDIRAFMLESLPEYMCPVQFVYTEEIPKTRTGKVQRYVLRSRENNHE